jgi:hypothetical protein
LPVPISHLINFIVYLAKNSYSPNTAKSYIAAIGFKMKMNNLTDSTDSFIVKKLLKGMSKTYKHADIRRPITVEILADIIRILPQICNSTYEAKLFSAVFVLSFRAFLRIGGFPSTHSHYFVIGFTHFCCMRCSPYTERMCVIVILIITQKSQCQFKNNSYLISSNLLMIEMTKE